MADPGVDYAGAFYQLADLMDIPARNASPKEVWESEMLPRLKDALSKQSKYEAAWREMHDALSWMQGHKGLTRYLGWNFARVANDLIKRAYPDLSKDIPNV